MGSTLSKVPKPVYVGVAVATPIVYYYTIKRGIDIEHKLQEDCLTHFINYPLVKNIFKQKYSHEVTDEAGTFLKNLYKETPKHRKSVSQKNPLGMVSHKKSLMTIFGHKHTIKNFIKRFDIS